MKHFIFMELSYINTRVVLFLIDRWCLQVTDMYKKSSNCIKKKGSFSLLSFFKQIESAVFVRFSTTTYCWAHAGAQCCAQHLKRIIFSVHLFHKHGHPNCPIWHLMTFAVILVVRKVYQFNQSTTNQHLH